MNKDEIIKFIRERINRWESCFEWEEGNENKNKNIEFGKILLEFLNG